MSSGSDMSGIKGRSCSHLDNFLGAMPMLYSVTMTATDTTKAVFNEDCPYRMRVVNSWFIMTGAGAASDTVKLTDGTNDMCTAVDVSSLGDTDRASMGEINNAYHVIRKGGSLKVVTASAALVEVYILCVRE